MKQHHLVIKWGTSRGADTYGYTLATLRDQTGKVRARTCGGGYDLRGTVFADWLESEYQSRLLTVANRMASEYSVAHGYVTRAPTADSLYGVFLVDENRVTLDGACGYSSMVRIAKAIRLTVSLIDAGKHCDVIIVTDNEVTP